MSGKKSKKKCCGKFKKKGKHCGSCPVVGGKKECVPDKKYCKDCDFLSEAKKRKKSKNKKN